MKKISSKIYFKLANLLMDLPPDDTVFLEDKYASSSSPTYDRLRKWVGHKLRETMIVPLTRKEIVNLKFAGLSDIEKNRIKYADTRPPAPEIMERMEENILDTCVE